MKVSRRELLKGLGAAGLGLAAAGNLRAYSGDSPKEQSIPKGKQMEKRQPNIVFIVADQLSAAFLGCYGSGVASTPTLDSLASKGVRFTRTYAHAPVCAPNRCSMFTGRCVDVHGVLINNYNLTNDNPLFTQVLKTNGYRTGGFGKFHFTCMWRPLPEDHSYYGFDESVATEDPRWGPWIDWIEQEHPDYYERALSTCWGIPYRTAYGRDKRNLDAAWQEAVKKHMTPRREASDWRMFYTSPVPWELHQTKYITDMGLDFIRRHKQNHADEPFFCFISYVDPHDPYDPPAPYDTMFDPSEVPDAIPQQVDHYGPRFLDAGTKIFEFNEVSGNKSVVRKLRAMYHGSVKLIDDQVARVVKYLEETGQMDNTIIVFTTDHGDMMGDHGFITKGPMHYDKSARVPLIIYGAGVEAGSVCDRLTSSLDLYPTFCDWAGVDLRPPLDGRSFERACTGSGEGCVEWPEVTVQVASATSIITNDGWRLSLYEERGQGQMFNLKDDPDEMRNLLHEPDFIKKRVELLERHSGAYNRYSRKERYGNLPLVDDKRCLVDGRQLPTDPLPW